MRLRKHADLLATLIVAGWFLIGRQLSAQTPFARENLERRASTSSPATDSGPSFLVGGQVGYRFNSTSFGDKLVMSAFAVYEIDFGIANFRLPIMANLSDLTENISFEAEPPLQTMQKIQPLSMSSTGARIGVYPYYVVHRGGSLVVIAHAEGAWKMNGVPDPYRVNVHVQQFRLAGGMDLGFGNANRRIPATVSVTPAVAFLDSAAYDRILLNGQAKSAIASLEITGVVPVARRVGVLLEATFGQSPVEGLNMNTVRTGLVVAVGRAKAP